ncbi:MAG: hypothetical protein Q9186_005686 [Xanthomendoza sp. 1 TL-2023]
MSEEIRNPSKIVPASMIASMVLNGMLGFGMLMAVLFCSGNLAKALGTTTGYPFMEIFLQGTQSVNGSTTMVAIVITLAMCATIAVLASSSRLTWSFARDRGLPGWWYLSKVEPRTCLPLIAIGSTTTISVLLSLISIGSPVALNDVLSVTIAGLFLSYLACCSLLLWRRCTGGIADGRSTPEFSGAANHPHSKHLTWGPFHVPGAAGIAVNAIGCAFSILVIFFSFWPPFTPVTARTMNYSVVVTTFVLVFSAVYYVFWAHKSYSGPVVEVSMYAMDRVDV